MSNTTRRWLLVVLVAVLSIGAIVLTLLALDHVRTRPVEGDVAPVPAFTQPPARQTPSPTPSETSAAPASYDRSQERFLTVSAGVLWRGTAGQCGATEPLLERSADEGQTWTDVTPRYLEIGQLVALNQFADGQAEIIALMGADCEVQALRTFTQGQFWESYPDVLAASRYVDPTAPGNILGTDSPVVAPCADARSLRTSEQVVAIVCEGTAYLRDKDADWIALPPTDVAALSLAEDDVVVAHMAEGCAGLTVTRYIGANSAAAEEAGCVDVADVALPTTIAISSGDALVWAGDEWFANSL